MWRSRTHQDPFPARRGQFTVAVPECPATGQSVDEEPVRGPSRSPSEIAPTLMKMSGNEAAKFRLAGFGHGGCHDKILYALRQ